MRWLPLIPLACLLAGCPARPADDRPRDAAAPDCIACPVHGEGPRPPADHWDGDTAATWHDACSHCHPILEVILAVPRGR